MTSALYRRYNPVFIRIAAKYTTDEALQEDCVSEAWAAVYSLAREKIADLRARKKLDPYLRMVARNTMLSYLDSWATGSWYTKRARSGDRQYVPIDHLLMPGLVQMTTDGTVVPGRASRKLGGMLARPLDEGGAVSVVIL